MKEQFKVKLWENFFTPSGVGLGSPPGVKLAYCIKIKIFFKALCFTLRVYSGENFKVKTGSNRYEKMGERSRKHKREWVFIVFKNKSKL